MRKWGDLQLALNWVFEMLSPFATHCNSTYFSMSMKVIKQVA
jgi:hypothetical protein